MNDINIHNDINEFNENLQKLSSHTTRIKLCKSILMKLKLNNYCKIYRTTDFYGLEDVNLMKNQIQKICEDDGSWTKPKIEPPSKKKIKLSSIPSLDIINESTENINNHNMKPSQIEKQRQWQMPQAILTSNINHNNIYNQFQSIDQTQPNTRNIPRNNRKI